VISLPPPPSPARSPDSSPGWATRKAKTLALVLFTGVSVDQLCKLAVESGLAPWERIALIPGFFYVTHTRNPGAAFGLFASVPEDIRLMTFVVVFLCALLVFAAVYRRLAPGDRIQSLGLGLIVAGAAGNFADRLLRDEVVDFIHVRLWGGYAWPDFNVADACIVTGVAILVIDLLSREASERASLH